jgi:hypothetical protein
MSQTTPRQYAERTHIVPTTLDKEQVGALFDYLAADRVFILDNEQPVGFDEKIRHLPLLGVVQVTRSQTQADIKWSKTNFYQLSEALIDIFEIIYREKALGNDVIVNLSGGTKPVAIALVFACSLADAGQPFYIPKKYGVNEDGTPEPLGPYDELFAANLVKPLNIKGIIPSKENKRRLLKSLLRSEGQLGVKSILVSVGLVSKKPPQNEDEKEARMREIQRHHRYASHLADDGLFQKQDSTYQLTEMGELIAKLVKIMDRVDKEVEKKTENESLTD